MIYAVIGILVLAVILGLYLVSKRNGFVLLQENINNAFAQIDVQLKRRYDLIPNLVSTVKGYAKHESGTLEKIVALRNQAAGATSTREKVELNNELSQALSQVLLTVEAYPDLKANTNFLELQGDLRELEQKIALSRQVYNDCVTKLNRMVKMFPSNIVANIFNFEAAAYLETAESERSNVKVEF